MSFNEVEFVWLNTNTSEGSVFLCSELPPTTLAEILAPNSLMTSNKFELTVDEWKFVGHPFSVQNKNFSIAFNIVFVLQVSLPYCGVYGSEHP